MVKSRCLSGALKYLALLICFKVFQNLPVRTVVGGKISFPINACSKLKAADKDGKLSFKASHKSVLRSTCKKLLISKATGN